MPARDQTSSLLARQHIQYEDPFAKFAQYANQKGAQIRADEREAQLQLERAQDRAFREAEAAKQQANREKSFGLQQAAEDRAKTEQAAKEATRQAYGKFGELLASPNQTQAQVAAIMKEGGLLDKAQKAGRVLTDSEQAELRRQVEADIGRNKGSLTQQRQLLLEQAPVKELYDTIKDPVTGQEVLRTRGDLDTAQQQALKESMLGNLDRRIDAEAARAQALQLHRESEAGANRRAAAALRKADEDKKAQQAQLTAMMKLYAPKETLDKKYTPETAQKEYERVGKVLDTGYDKELKNLQKQIKDRTIDRRQYEMKVKELDKTYNTARSLRATPSLYEQVPLLGSKAYKEASPADMLTRINEVLRPGSGATAAEQVMAIKLAEELRTLAAEKEAGLTKADSDFRLFKAQEDYKAKLKKEEDD